MRKRGTTSVAGGFQTSNSHSFCKDGRKIRVGDCALFEPPQDSPPFIGIIRYLITGKDSKAKFGVNWLYRASEVELDKGIQLEAAPNEIFYSFHKDEVPCASLLHPCKVAFLPKGVELPSGISSFICRRVYDIDEKCLWWLTDQNYIDKRQEEVDHLLSKTSRDMHATIQSGGRSPKTMSDAAPGSLAKAGSDGAQSVSSVSSHGKGKKRERSDQDSEPVKRLQKLDGVESYQSKSGSILKAEIAKITDRGGLTNYESVEKLVRLMAPDKASPKMDLNGRSMLAGVVAATDKFDCLSWFVQLKGLPVFDAWLQEVHKGKIGDGNKDGDKPVEEFLLILLCALDKLPVNLRALQMCNIGKSVNHLRSHKCVEIQRKARTLVDTWKKRVEAEMNIDDGKPGSNMAVAWHGRRTSESSQGGHKNSGNTENAVKGSSSSQPSGPRALLVKPTQGDDSQISASPLPGYSKAALSPAAGAVNSKDNQPKASAVGESSDHVPMTVEDEKSSSSSQSHSQSSSSDHIKTADSLGKEDPRSSTAGSTGANETLRRASRSRKPIGGLSGCVSRGAHRDGGSDRSPSLSKLVISEKVLPSGSINEKMHDAPVLDGNSHKLIVKIPNRGRSPAMNVNGGSVNEQGPSKCTAVSLAFTDKQEKLECCPKEKGDANQLNDASDVTTKSWHSSDLKDVLTGSDEADGTSAANIDEVRSSNGNDTKKPNESPKVASSSAAQVTKPWKSNEPSFTSMNALVESCVKHSEAGALISAADDDGMNLLASVAASEMSKCDSVAANSPEINAAAEECGAGNSGRSSNVDGIQEPTYYADKTTQDAKNQVESAYLETNVRDVMPSTDERLATDISNSGLPNKQDDKQLCDATEITSNVVTVELAPDSTVGNQKKISDAECEDLPAKNHSEDTRKEVSKGTSVHSSGVSNRDIEISVSEVVFSGVQMKEFPSTTHSDAVGPNDQTHTPLGAEACLDSGNISVMDVERLSQRKVVNNTHSQCDMEQNLDKSECHDIKSSSSAGNYKEGRPQKEALGHCNGSSDLNKASAIKVAECSSTDAPNASLTPGMAMLKFDLNEGFTADEIKNEEQKSTTRAPCSTAVHVVTPLPLPVTAVSNGIPASVTVAAAAKGAFIPLDDLLRTRGELGWKGSAATSAFRPAEPRKTSEMPVDSSTSPSVTQNKTSRPFLNIDLNAPDDSMQDDIPSHSGAFDLSKNENSTTSRGFGGLDLDLNQVDEATEVGQRSVTSDTKLEIPWLQSKPTIISNGESTARRNFDLNNGPMHDEVNAEASTIGQNMWSNMPAQPPAVSLWMNTGEMGNFASWFPQGNVIPAATVPSVFPDRGDQSFPMVKTGTAQRIYYTPPGCNNPFAPDVFRGPVLSSSPALSFPSAPYQYPVFPFGPSFPVASAAIPGSATYLDPSSAGRHNFPTGQSQYLGHPSIVSSGYPRPFLVNNSDGRSNGGLDNSSRWGIHGLDLNSGPGGTEVEGRNDPTQYALRQFSIANSQAFTEEQLRTFQSPGVVLQRKEPDGGWDAEKSKQQSWH